MVRLQVLSQSGPESYGYEEVLLYTPQIFGTEASPPYAACHNQNTPFCVCQLS